MLEYIYIWLIHMHMAGKSSQQKQSLRKLKTLNLLDKVHKSVALNMFKELKEIRV